MSPRKFHSIAALCGDGLRPELQALFDRLAVDRDSELFVRSDGMAQAGPSPQQGEPAEGSGPTAGSQPHPSVVADLKRTPR